MEKQYLEERGFVLPGSVLTTEMDGTLKYILATVARPAEWIKTGLCEGVKVLKKLRKRPDLKKKRVEFRKKVRGNWLRALGDF
jgi:hypothetical protein